MTWPRQKSGKTPFHGGQTDPSQRPVRQNRNEPPGPKLSRVVFWSPKMTIFEDFWPKTTRSKGMDQNPNRPKMTKMLLPYINNAQKLAVICDLWSSHLCHIFRRAKMTKLGLSFRSGLQDSHTGSVPCYPGWAWRRSFFVRSRRATPFLQGVKSLVGMAWRFQALLRDLADKK